MPVPTCLLTRADYERAWRVARIAGYGKIVNANAFQIHDYGRAAGCSYLGLMFARAVMAARVVPDRLRRPLQDRALLRHGAYWLAKYKEAA